MAESFAGADRCDTCDATGLQPWLTRADGLCVLACPTCGAGVVEQLPGDLDAVYEGDYYTGGAEGVGYDDYAFTAEHSVGWAAALADVLRPAGGAALDIGAADGLLLSKLGPAFVRRAGVEMHPQMGQVLQDRGHELLARDVYDPSLHAFNGSFDVVTAIAVFEHVPQFARAVRRALDLARPDGLLVFEVPVMSATGSNEAWLTSSLEHLHYPTARSLRHLFVEVLGMGLHGEELLIQGYGSTFVGIASRDQAVATAAGVVWRRVAGPTALEDLTRPERRARTQLLLLHAARTGSDVVAGLDAIPASDLTPAAVRRLRELWTATVQARDDAEAGARELGGYLAQVEQARDEAQGRAADLAGQLSAALDVEAGGHRTALSADADWERQAHLTHAQLEAVMSSTAWRSTAPARNAVTSLRRARATIEVLRGQVNRRRVVAAVELLRSGDVATVRQRITAVRGTALAAAGLSTTVERGPVVPVVQQPVPQDRPLVSVVITCFNYGRYVEEAVRSVVDQTLDSVQIIVVDGGSTDGSTPEVLRRLQEELPEVTVLFREGRHLVGDNRNHGIAASHGRYVCCLDADDALLPTYLEMAAYLLEVHDYDVVSTTTRTFGLREETFGLLPRPSLDDMLLANNLSTVAVFRRSLWQECGGFHDTGTGADHIHEDWKLWVRFAAQGARMINITGVPLFRYRVHGELSLSNLAGTPDMARQRSAIALFNADVVDDAAVVRSRQRRDEVHEVQDAFVNLNPARMGTTMTVLITMPFLIIGGAERLISEISRHLGEQDVRVVIVTTLPVDPAFGDTTEWFSGATSEIYHLPRLLDVGRWERFLDYLVVTKGVDVLWQAGSAFAYAMLPSLRAKHPRLRVVDLLFNTIGHTAANRAHAGDIDLVLVENAEVERWLLARGEAPERVRLVESGVDLDAYRPRARPLSDGPLRVGFSGRFSEEKDPLAFLAIAAAMGQGADVEFVMTGAGPLERKVRAGLASRAPSGRVTLLGVVEDMMAHLSSLDVLVLPSRLDGRPVVVLEALALGIPVVASAVGALPQLIQDGVTGFLCQPGDHASFADRLHLLLDDRSRLLEMGAAARRFAEAHLDAAVMFSHYEQALRSLVPQAEAAAQLR